MGIQEFVFLVICVLIVRAIRAFKFRNEEKPSVREEIVNFIGHLVVSIVVYLVIYNLLIFILE